jgi:hypothetical protein
MSGVSLGRGLAALALVFALSAAVAAPAQAKLHVKGHITDEKNRDYQVQVNGSNITIKPTGADTVNSDGEGLVIDDGAGLVRIFSDAEVPHGQHIDGDVVAVFGNVHVAGSVAGNTVAVFGSVVLDSSATVSGDAVSVGGGLDARDGSKVAGQSVSVGFLPLTFGIPALPLTLMMILIGWMLTVGFGSLIGLLFPTPLSRMSRTASKRTALSLVLGLISGPFVPVAAILLMVTVIGIPFGLLLPFVWIFATFLGHIAAVRVLGAKFLRRGPGDGGAFAPLAVGSIFVASFFFVGAAFWQMGPLMRSIGVFFFMAGGLIHLGLSAIGCGAVLLSRFGTHASAEERAQAMTGFESSAPPVPPAPPSAPAASGVTLG